MLWPEPASVSYTSGGATAADMIVLPSLRRPRLIVPAGHRAAAAAVRQYGEPGSRAALVASRGLALLLRSGLGRVVCRDRLHVDVPAGAMTFEAYLKHHLGLTVGFSTHLRPRRANSKLVLQLLSADGATVGFAKIGVTPLTRDLVRAEAAALDRLAAARLQALAVPSVLHAGEWEGYPVLVLSPLAIDRRRTPLVPERLSPATLEVASVAGVEPGPLVESGYWRSLLSRLSCLADGDDRSALLAGLGRVGDAHADTVLSYGCWHGDWTPWNMASTREGLMVWDWERFALGVPLGFDALHFWLWSEVVSPSRDRRSAAAGCITHAPRILTPFDVDGDQASLTAALYLADLATRALTDREATANAYPPPPGGWLIPAMAEWADRL